jgi:L-fuculose-phosphate aldolase
MSAADEGALRRGIVDTALDMERLGINQGTSGNVSARLLDGFLITPSGVPARELSVESIVYLPLDVSDSDDVLRTARPSSEWRIHRDLLRARPDMHAVVHTHSTAATALAMHGREIPAVHYMVAAAGGTSIRCAPYALFGTQALSDHALAALEGRRACLLAHHGVVALGADLSRAVWLAHEVEVLARQYLLALQFGAPPVLTDEQMHEVLERFKTYGKRSKDD